MSKQPLPQDSSVAVLGAGLAGLTAARALTERGYTVRLFDKARGPGGRMAARREPFLFDHGAQYFTVRDQRFQEVVDEWIRDGVAGPWTPRLGVADDGSVTEKETSVLRYVGVPRMSAITRHLSAGLDLETRTRVETVVRAEGTWHLRTDAGDEIGPFDALLVTLPPPQAADVLRTSAPDLAARAGAVVMQPCWAVMAAFSDRLPISFDGAFIHGEALSWVARNESKPGRPDPECWVLHGSAAWSDAHLEDAPETIREQLLTSFFETFGLDPVTPTYATAHRWRYAQAAEPLEVGCLYDAELGLGVGGDWCHGSRVEGAFLSGRALASRLVDGGEA